MVTDFFVKLFYFNFPYQIMYHIQIFVYFLIFPSCSRSMFIMPSIDFSSRFFFSLVIEKNTRDTIKYNFSYNFVFLSFLAVWLQLACINPIGNMNKQDLKVFLRWVLLIVGRCWTAPPTAELEPIRYNYRQVHTYSETKLL